MTIKNQAGRTGHDLRHQTKVEGQILEGVDPKGRPYANPLRREIWRVAVGGTASDGDYVSTITGPDGTSFSVTTTRSTTPSTNAALATQHALDVMAHASAKGVVKSATVVSSTNVDIRFKHAGRPYTVTGSAPGSGTLTFTERTSCEGVSLPVGRFAVLDSIEDLPALRLPVSTDAATAIGGVLVRPHSGIARPVNATIDDVPAYPPGETLTLVHECIIGLKNVDTTAASAGGVVYAVVDDTGGDDFGTARATDDGSYSVTLDQAKCRWLEDTAAGAVGPVLCRF